MRVESQLYSGQSFPEGYEPRYFFGDLRDTLPTKNPFRHYDYRKKIWKNLVETAEYFCICTFKKCVVWGRVQENVDLILCCFADIDDDSRAVTEADIRRRIEGLGLDMPTTIHTSPGHFHLKFYLRVPVKAENPKELRYWKYVQSLLHAAFKDLHADDIPIHDIVRCLRNEFAKGFKRTYKISVPSYDYPNLTCQKVLEAQGLTLLKGVKMEFEVTTIDTGGRFTLSEIRWAIEGAGYSVETEEQVITLDEREKQLEDFFKKNPHIEITQKNLSAQTGIPISSLQVSLRKLQDKGVLTSEVLGTRGNRRTLFVLKSRVEVKTHCNNKKDFTTLFFYSSDLETQESVTTDANLKRCRNVVSTYNSMFFEGIRNERLFKVACACRELSEFVTVESVLWELRSGIAMYESEDFDRDEIIKTIESALRPRYHEKWGFMWSNATLIEEGLLI